MSDPTTLWDVLNRRIETDEVEPVRGADDLYLFTRCRDEIGRLTRERHETLQNSRAYLEKLEAINRALRHAVECHEVYRRQLDARESALLEKVEEWQLATGLVCPSEERGGDPGGVTPTHLSEHLRALREKLEGAKLIFRGYHAKCGYQRCDTIQDQGDTWVRELDSPDAGKEPDDG